MKTIHDYTEYRYLNFHVDPRVLKLSLDQVLVPRYRYPGTVLNLVQSSRFTFKYDLLNLVPVDLLY